MSLDDPLPPFSPPFFTFNRDKAGKETAKSRRQISYAVENGARLSSSPARPLAPPPLLGPVTRAITRDITASAV